MTLTLGPQPTRATAGPPPRRRRRTTSPGAHGEPSVWSTGGALALALAAIFGLLGLVLVQGAATFWPGELVLLRGDDGAAWLGEVTESERYTPGPHVLEGLTEAQRARAERLLAEGDGTLRRRLVAIGNYRLTGRHYEWVPEFLVTSEERPEWALLVERAEWGRFHGEPVELLEDGQPVARGPQETWDRFRSIHDEVQDRMARRERLEDEVIGRVAARVEAARLRVRGAELEHGRDSDAWRAADAELSRVEEANAAEYAEVRAQIEELDRENARFELLMVTSDGQRVPLGLTDIVRAVPENRLGFFGRIGVYLSRWYEFVTEDPRESGEGGVYPAIFGTVVMTLLMSLLVVPLGVLAALYLREYAKQGPLVSAVRIAVNNLAGVPSIVFGVFGLGFFCYLIGSSIDELLFAAKLPNPTFGKGGVLWASLTLALLTLPVVVVASEEALAAVPGSMREGSYACGATKWQTIRRIVLPRALPGIMTGMILAVARGAGEVAPLMLVGAAGLAHELPVDGEFPFFHGSRSFMHLGYHIFDLGFQSQNSEAAKPLVFTTTLLLIAIVVALNLSAIAVRTRLRRKFVS